MSYSGVANDFFENQVTKISGDESTFITRAYNTMQKLSLFLVAFARFEQSVYQDPRIFGTDWMADCEIAKGLWNSNSATMGQYEVSRFHNGYAPHFHVWKFHSDVNEPQGGYHECPSLHVQAWADIYCIQRVLSTHAAMLQALLRRCERTTVQIQEFYFAPQLGWSYPRFKNCIEMIVESLMFYPACFPALPDNLWPLAADLLASMEPVPPPSHASGLPYQRVTCALELCCIIRKTIFIGNAESPPRECYYMPTWWFFDYGIPSKIYKYDAGPRMIVLSRLLNFHGIRTELRSNDDAKAIAHENPDSIRLLKYSLYEMIRDSRAPESLIIPLREAIDDYLALWDGLAARFPLCEIRNGCFAWKVIEDIRSVIYPDPPSKPPTKSQDSILK